MFYAFYSKFRQLFYVINQSVKLMIPSATLLELKMKIPVLPQIVEEFKTVFTDLIFIPNQTKKIPWSEKDIVVIASPKGSPFY